MALDELQRIKFWLVEHRADHPVEYHLWDLVLTLWVMGWVGWFPTFAFGQGWAAPLCFGGTMVPRLYVGWRTRAHQARRLRCDWLR